MTNTELIEKVRAFRGNALAKRICLNLIENAGPDALSMAYAAALKKRKVGDKVITKVRRADLFDDLSGASRAFHQWCNSHTCDECRFRTSGGCAHAWLNEIIEVEVKVDGD